MRIGETLALTWKDINFDKREIDINKTVNIINQDVIVSPPKTENGYRTLGMSDTVYDLVNHPHLHSNECSGRGFLLPLPLHTAIRTIRINVRLTQYPQAYGFG